MATRPMTVATTEVKNRCLAVLDNVARTRQPLIVTKRGRPVAKIVPTVPRTTRKLLGSVKFHGNSVDPTLGEWEIEQ